MQPASILTSTFLTVLSTFHLFPLHAPITMFALDAPHGKHSINSRLNMNGQPVSLPACYPPLPSGKALFRPCRMLRDPQTKADSLPLSLRWLLAGKFAWWSMELVSPVTCLATLAVNHATLSRPNLLLLVLYLIHYLNRSTISVLRSSGMARTSKRLPGSP
jgi:hypothetical protein